MSTGVFVEARGADPVVLPDVAGIPVPRYNVVKAGNGNGIARQTAKKSSMDRGTPKKKIKQKKSCCFLISTVPSFFHRHTFHRLHLFRLCEMDGDEWRPQGGAQRVPHRGGRR